MMSALSGLAGTALLLWGEIERDRHSELRLAEEIRRAPFKSRLTSASASIRIEAGPEVGKLFENPNKSSDGSIASLKVGKSKEWTIEGQKIVGNGPWSLFLRSDSSEHMGNASGSTIFLQFTTPPYFPINSSDTVEDFLKSADMVDFSILSIPEGTIIRDGEITLTLNGTIKKTFKIPQHHTSWFGIRLLDRPAEPTTILQVNVSDIRASP